MCALHHHHRHPHRHLLQCLHVEVIALLVRQFVMKMYVRIKLDHWCLGQIVFAANLTHIVLDIAEMLVTTMVLLLQTARASVMASLETLRIASSLATMVVTHSTIPQ